MDNTKEILKNDLIKDINEINTKLSHGDESICVVLSPNHQVINVSVNSFSTIQKERLIKRIEELIFKIHKDKKDEVLNKKAELEKKLKSLL